MRRSRTPAPASRTGTAASAASSRPASSPGSTPTRATSSPVSTTMTRLIEAVREAALATGGLVDGTLLGEIEAAGYVGDIAAPLAAAACAAARSRPPSSAAEPAFALGRRLRRWVGGHPPARRRLRQRRAGQGPVRGPDRRAAARAAQLRRRLRRGPALRRARAAAARGRRSVRRRAPSTSSSWPRPPSPRAGSAGAAGSDPDGRPAHHLLDPATGRPAFTGVVQATALAPTAVEAEWRAKAAVLSGPERRGGLARARRRRRARRRHPLRHRTPDLQSPRRSTT